LPSRSRTPRTDGGAALYLDGWLVLRARGAFRRGGGTLGIGVRAGSVEIRDLAVVLPGR